MESLHQKLDDVLLQISSPVASEDSSAERCEKSLIKRATKSPEDRTVDAALMLYSTNSAHISTTASTSSPPVPPRLRSFQVPPRQISEGHRLLAWPAVQQLLQRDLAELPHWGGATKGTEKWLIEISADFGTSLPTDWNIDIFYTADGFLNLKRGRSISLTKSFIESLCSAYFQTFHCTYPILDRHHFYSKVLPRVCSQSFDEADEGSALVLFVLALGAIAQEGSLGSPIVEEPSGRQTGIRGGTVQRPPGLVFLNEAKRRLGFALTQWNLNNLQSFILSA